MKKKYVVTILLLLVCSFALLAEGKKKEINVLAGIGSADSDLKGLVLELGIEKQYTRKLYGQLIIDYYSNPFEVSGEFNSYAYGFSLFGAYKMPASSRLKIVLKLGLHITMMREKWKWLGSMTSADLGIAGGGGLEFKITDRAALYGGVTAKTSVEESRFWFKCSGGVIFKLK